MNFIFWLPYNSTNTTLSKKSPNQKLKSLFSQFSVKLSLKRHNFWSKTFKVSQCIAKAKTKLILSMTKHKKKKKNLQIENLGLSTLFNSDSTVNVVASLISRPFHRYTSASSLVHAVDSSNPKFFTFSQLLLFLLLLCLLKVI